MAMPRRWRILYELRESGVALLRNTRPTSISRRSVEVVNADGKPGSVDADSVILAIGTQPNRELAAAVESVGVPVRTIGDAQGVGYLDGAMRDGARIAREI